MKAHVISTSVQKLIFIYSYDFVIGANERINGLSFIHCQLLTFANTDAYVVTNEVVPQDNSY